MTALATSDGVRTPSRQATAPARFFGPCMHEESSWTTPSAFGMPPNPTLVSVGSSSQRLTPAMRASRTSDPPVIMVKAFATPVMSPPFLYTFPLLEATTTGVTVFFTIIVGAWAGGGAWAATALTEAAATTAAAPDSTNSRRFTFFAMRLSSVDRTRRLYSCPPAVTTRERLAPGVDAGRHPPIRWHLCADSTREITTA